MKLKHALANKKFIVMSEIQTPLWDVPPRDLVACLAQVRDRVDGVAVA